MGTVHKAKGLEFDTVHVLDDFVKVPCARHNLAQLPHFRVGEQTESSLWGCLAFSGMVIASWKDAVGRSPQTRGWADGQARGDAWIE